MNILKTVNVTESPWIRSKRVVYENDNGQMMDWDYIERVHARSSVLIMPRFKESSDLIFIRQYRVIFDCYVIGFPAGVISDGEDVETCALRELMEETGYTGKIVQISPELTLNSALIKETACCVVVELEEDATPREQKLEPSEKIEVYRVKKDQLGDFFKRAAARGDLIGGGPWYMFMAMQYL
ncbi:MAG: NUDIX hydrolase [Deltaproteobacteria bacterium]|nr:NUDIX hydrolase [Deltaproteobacteria bacterium]MBW2020770.1 NUDIX hydrolase [Deltaproteobacteria bacterium]MBW2075372.1 NUDIX hydrolase [Deltaproteobacteria bacterium]RLB80494.1 MAG: NUDIX hydrolase [Deltaproteobacteria bacterium]